MGDDGKPAEADATLSPTEIERIVGKFVAEKAGIAAPYVHAFRWVWVPEKGPVAHCKITEAPLHLVQLKPRGSR